MAGSAIPPADRGVEDKLGLFRVQGTKTAPGECRTGASWPVEATSPGQPRVAGAARAAANRSREGASGRPSSGTCQGDRGGISAATASHWLAAIAPPIREGLSHFTPPPCD